jgi:hypothetical protein
MYLSDASGCHRELSSFGKVLDGPTHHTLCWSVVDDVNDVCCDVKMGESGDASICFVWQSPCLSGRRQD